MENLEASATINSEKSQHNTLDEQTSDCLWACNLSQTWSTNQCKGHPYIIYVRAPNIEIVWSPVTLPVTLPVSKEAGTILFLIRLAPCLFIFVGSGTPCPLLLKVVTSSFLWRVVTSSLLWRAAPCPLRVAPLSVFVQTGTLSVSVEPGTLFVYVEAATLSVSVETGTLSVSVKAGKGRKCILLWA